MARDDDDASLSPTVRPKRQRGRVALSAVGATHVGLVRRRNEDAFGVRAAEGIAFVADGLGGCAAGDVASGIAAACVLEAADAVRARQRREADDLFDGAAARAAGRLREHERAHPQAAGLGTTLTAVRLRSSGVLRVLHIGDSRAYRVRTGRLQPITQDHSLVGEMVERGLLTREAARTHRRSNIVTRCIGGRLGRDVEADSFDVRVEAGDRLLLATDGLTDMLPESRIAELCRAHDDAGALVQALLGEALDAGGRDNVTLIVADVRSDA